MSTTATATTLTIVAAVSAVIALVVTLTLLVDRRQQRGKSSSMTAAAGAGERSWRHWRRHAPFNAAEMSPRSRRTQRARSYERALELARDPSRVVTWGTKSRLDQVHGWSTKPGVP